MKRAALIASLLLLATWCIAQETPVATSRVVHDNANPLPRYLAPEEQGLPLSPVVRDRTPPTGEVYTPAEYEPCDGMFIAWEGYESILTQMTVYATTGDPNAQVWVVVDSSSEQSTAYNTLNSAGAVMSRVHFIVRTTDTVWIRDYGPRFIFEDGNRAIVDHTYNRPRPNDNALNDYLATLWGIPQYDLPLVHGGGNFHLFSNGEAFMSTLILAENPSYTEQQIKDLFQQYENLSLTIYTGFPTNFDSTRHIDMWMLPLGDHKVIIGQYAQSTGQPYTITENAVADLLSRGYTVYRTPGWNSGGTHYTYTNSVVLNHQVFLTKFNVSQDAQALAVYQTAMPGYTIRQIDCSGIIGAAGAMHCIMMHVPAYAPGPIPVVTVTAPNGGELLTSGQVATIAWTAHDDLGVTAIDIFLSKDGGATYPDTIATGLLNTGTFDWTVPSGPSTQCRIQIIAHDADGNSGADTSNADFAITPNGPQVIYTYPLNTNPGWTISGGQWAFGHPTGGGGAYGNPDPNNGHTGTNVYGYNLNGDYANNLPEYHLTTTALDCSDLSAVKLRFWRWLGVEQPTYDHAYIRASHNGSTWTTIWQNDAEVADGAWTQPQYDLSAVADHQPTVYIRWTMGTTDSAWTYCGWNLDDVEIVAVRALVPGDLNCDDAVDFDDINPFVLALSDPAAYAAEYPDCNIFHADCNEDGLVDFDDINAFVALLSQ